MNFIAYYVAFLHRSPFLFFSSIAEGNVVKTEKPLKSFRKSNTRSTTKFPVDYFEHCQVSSNIEFGGSDILYVYNVNQVKSRLNTAGMYIANTKVSRVLSAYLCIALLCWIIIDHIMCCQF